MFYQIIFFQGHDVISHLIKAFFGCFSSFLKYRKIPKISPGAYIFQRPFWRGLSTEGILRFTIDWASLEVGSKFTVFTLFYFVFEGNFPSASLRGVYIWRGDLTEGFLRYRFEGLIFVGAYTWRGLFSEFCGTFFVINWHVLLLFSTILYTVLSLSNYSIFRA